MYQPNNLYQNQGVSMPQNGSMSYVNLQTGSPNPYMNIPGTGINTAANWNLPYPNNYQRQPQISGRMIGNISEVVPNEVPMDGSVSFFPQSDYSCIYAKKWNTDGTIQTVKFVPVVETDKTQETSASNFKANWEDLADDMANISNRLENIEKLLTPKTTRTTKEESK